jgi:hypothetical protein
MAKKPAPSSPLFLEILFLLVFVTCLAVGIMAIAIPQFIPPIW